jgi:hypothetical protein
MLPWDASVSSLIMAGRADEDDELDDFEEDEELDEDEDEEDEDEKYDDYEAEFEEEVPRPGRRREEEWA